MKKILFIYTDWAASEARRKSGGFGGVTYYRVMKPVKHLRALGYDVTVVGEDLKKYGETAEQLWPTVFSQFDAVVVKQIDNPEAAAPMFFYAERYGKPIIMDLDDDYFNVKPDMPAWEFYKPGSPKRSTFAAALSLVDGLIVSTQPLKDSYQKILKEAYQIDMPIYVCPNGNDRGDWKSVKKRRPKKGVVKIGYAGSITHNSDIAMVVPALRVILERYPQVKIEVLGALDADSYGKIFYGWPDSLTDRIEARGGTHSWDGYPDLLCSQRWDIGIAPLVDDVFTRGKSHIKWMEYTMAGVATVASPTYPYSQPIFDVPVIEDGKTGFLCRSTDEWVMVLSSLIENADARQEIVQNAYKAISENWQYEKWAPKWADAIEDILCNFQTRRTKTESSRTASASAR
jgi:glycosyltransferase involved in cell wall biosynthesis